MISPTGVPSANSPDAAPLDVAADTVNTDVPGDSSVPCVRNQSAPLWTMPATWASVSTLLTRVGGASPASPAIASVAGPPEGSPISVAPWRYGGAMRGNGGRPAVTSRSAVSSPSR